MVDETDVYVDDWSDLDDLDNTTEEESSMSKQVTGIVERIVERNVRTKRGDSVAYSICVREQGAAEDAWYGNGFTRPSCREGSSVRFNAVQNSGGYWNIDGNIEVLKDQAAPAAGQGRAGTVVLGNRDKSITLQTAYKVASGMVNDMFTHGIITFPKTKKDAQAAYESAVEDLAFGLQKKFLEPDKYDTFVDQDVEEEEQEFGEFED